MTSPVDLEPARAPESPVSLGDRPAFRHRSDRHGLIGPFGARQIALALVAVVVVGVLLVAVTTPLGTTDQSGPRDPRATPYLIGPAVEGLRVGDVAPDFSAPRPDGSTFQLTDLDGHAVRLADLRGKGVWVNFWASWCPPCQAETPILRDLYTTYRNQGLAIVGISVQESSAADVRAYAQKYGLGYTVAADLSGDIFHRFKVYALPTQFFIDRTGVIRSIVQGPVDATSATAHVEDILASRS